MATTIRSTDLDFTEIKNNLKTYLAQQDEFADYNFEASGLSNLLDVLAYNTHYNALLANFALNESYLPTAQLRSSLVGLAGSLGYTVGSRTASYGVVQMYVTPAGSPSTVTMPAGTTFTTTVDGQSYTFSNRDTLIASDNGSGQYFFALDGNINVPIYEGLNKVKTFIAGAGASEDSYIIPANTLDLDTVTVKVFDNTTTEDYSIYTNINVTTTIDATSRIFVIKETPNGFYEITFGNGVRLGQTPVPGNKIEVEYSTVAGVSANGARTFTPDSTLNGNTITVTTIATSAGGNSKEDLESIRKNAPYLYATQNRMVTAEDYSALILRNFSGVIDDIKTWGGEDNIPPEYGKVFTSIVFSTDDETIQDNAKIDISELADDLSVASFDLEFIDPVETFLEVDVIFQFNPNLTSFGQTQVEANVRSTMQNYFDTNLGGFDQSFRRSNLLTDVDETDPSILSSRASIRMQYLFTPTTGVDTYQIEYPTSISNPSDDVRIILSGNFYLNGKICYLQNRLSSTIIEVIEASTGVVYRDNIGSYDATTGVLSLTGFSPSLISSSEIKIVATPANESVINPQRFNILKYDASASSASAVITDTV